MGTDNQELPSDVQKLGKAAAKIMVACAIDVTNRAIAESGAGDGHGIRKQARGREPADNVADLFQVGKARERELRNSGYETVEDVAAASVGELVEVNGISWVSANQIQEHAVLSVPEGLNGRE